MDLKKYKASVQLAQMRFTADPSDANRTLLEAAQEAYDLAENPEKKTEDLPVPQEPEPPAATDPSQPTPEPVTAQASPEANQPPAAAPAQPTPEPVAAQASPEANQEPAAVPAQPKAPKETDKKKAESTPKAPKAREQK